MLEKLEQGWDFLVPLTGYCSHMPIHVKLEKLKRGRSPSLHLGKEGDFARNHSATFFSSINLQILAEILKMRYSLI